MSHRSDFARADVCIWMSAGLLTYKLCDHDFDCDNCPLDAALRGNLGTNARRERLLVPTSDPVSFPTDRCYTAGHVWIQSVGGGKERVVRCGVDAFAAAIIGRCSRVAWEISGQTLPQSAQMCRIDVDLGFLPLGMPVRGTVVAGNLALRTEPDRLVMSPYESGWIVELMSHDPYALEGLLTAEVARKNAQQDLRWFRRRVATQLWSGTDAVGTSMADGGEIVGDLRQMLGGPAYLELLRDMIH